MCVCVSVYTCAYTRTSAPLKCMYMYIHTHCSASYIKIEIFYEKRGHIFMCICLSTHIYLLTYIFICVCIYLHTYTAAPRTTRLRTSTRRWADSVRSPRSISPTTPLRNSLLSSGIIHVSMYF